MVCEMYTFHILLVMVWLQKPKLLTSSLVSSYVQRWALCINCQAMFKCSWSRCKQEKSYRRFGLSLPLLSCEFWMSSEKNLDKKESIYMWVKGVWEWQKSVQTIQIWKQLTIKPETLFYFIANLLWISQKKLLYFKWKKIDDMRGILLSCNWCREKVFKLRKEHLCL